MTADELVSFVSEATVRDSARRLFDDVVRKITQTLPQAEVHHVGSTAIPGALTKGDLDVQVRVTAADYEASRDRLAMLYAINKGGFVAADACSFEDYDTNPPHGVHLTVIGGSCDIQWRFRDALRASDELKQRYEALKRRFHGGSMSSYREAKEQFVVSVQDSVIYRNLEGPDQHADVGH